MVSLDEQVVIAYRIVDEVGHRRVEPYLDLRPAAITAILAAVMWGAKPVLKRKVSPLALIAVSACLGILVYGI